MSLSDLFCVERHKDNFLNLVKNNIDITFANEQEMTSLLSASSFNEIIEFSKTINKTVVITRGEKGSMVISNKDVYECKAQPDLRLVDLTGAGDLFAGGFLHGYVNNMGIEKSLEKGTEMSSKVIKIIGARL